MKAKNLQRFIELAQVHAGMVEKIRRRRNIAKDLARNVLEQPNDIFAFERVKLSLHVLQQLRSEDFLSVCN